MFLGIYEYPSRRSVLKAYPAAAAVVRVTGGWRVFFDLYECDLWKRQK